MPVSSQLLVEKLPAPHELRWQAMRSEDLDAVLAIENASYSHPWTRGNFQDGLKASFHMPMLCAGQQLLGYSVTMLGFEEAHLLNITVHPQCRGRGLGRVLLDGLALWAQRSGAQCIWLEVRQSHARTQALYCQNGYDVVATRKNYYPLDAQQREDAIIMKRMLAPLPVGQRPRTQEEEQA